MTRLAEVLDQDYESVEDAARAALEAAFEIYEDKAKWTVVGQLLYSQGTVDPASPAASKIALGRYGTEGQANAAAQSLTISTATHEQFRAWVLPVWHGTPASFFKERKQAKAAGDAGHSAADALNHVSEWMRNNPDKPRSEYPGMPEPDPRSDCPICGAQPEEEEDT